MEQFRLMSNNIWCREENAPAWAALGEDCSAPHRVKGFVRVYAETLPDVIGLQECTALLADLLMQRLRDAGLPYALLWGRHTPIIYRTDKLELIDSDFQIYPSEVPGYAGAFNNSHSKSYCIAVFRTKKEQKTFLFASTHLWWKTSDPAQALGGAQNYQAHSDEARTYQLNLLMDSVENLTEQYHCPAFIVGDMNATYHSPALQSAFLRGYAHGHDLAVEYRDEKNGHHFCFAEGFDHYENPKPFPESIDHFLLKDYDGVTVKRFDRFYEDYYMKLSDHFPMWCDLEL